MILFKKKNALLTAILLCLGLPVVAQQADSTKTSSTFSGSIGITNNGFSIIPTFSLNSPAAIVNLSWRRERFSFEPDIRLVPDASKGGMLWWLRYRLVDRGKFGFRIGTHPAFTLVRRTITDNGKAQEITQMLRFVGFEAVPSYQFNKHVGVSAMYLQGNGLQKEGPQTTRVLFLNLNVTQIGLGDKLRFNAFPSVYFLYTDGSRGDYLAFTGVLSHAKLPFSLQSTINQTFTSNIPGNRNFMWNVALNYRFNKQYRRI